MYIAKVPNRNSPPAILIRESYREGGKPKTRTVANISKWKPARIEALRKLLKGNVDLSEAQQFEITRSQPHGHVAAVLGTLRKVGLERILHSRQSRERDLAVAMIVARIVEPGSKLATARGLSKQTLTSSLGECVGVEDTNEDELYEALDWLLSRQAAIEKKLAKRHLQERSLVTGVNYYSRRRQLEFPLHSHFSFDQERCECSLRTRSRRRESGAKS